MKSFFPLLLLLSSILLVMACNRQTSQNPSNGEYTYTPPKSTDPSVFTPKPNDPPPPPPVTPIKTDTVIVIVETPPVSPTPPTPPVAPVDSFAQAEPWMKSVAGTYIVAKIKRTPCYGTCPTYVAAIFSDGTAFFYGERFVEQIGYFQGRITTEQLNNLVKMSYQNNFYSLAPSYPTDGRYITDLPSTYIHINSGINQKTIKDRGNAPEELDVLEEALHTLLLSIQWKPIK